MRKEADYKIQEYSVHAGTLTFDEFKRLWIEEMGQREELVNRRECALDCFVVKWRVPDCNTKEFKRKFEKYIKEFEEKVEEVCKLKVKLKILGVYSCG